MKYPINYDLEKHLLKGCTIIQLGSLDYDSVNEAFTHVLVQCPENYLTENDKDKRPVKFISIQVFDNNGKWFDATYHYSTKRHTIKHWFDNLTEDRISKIRAKKANILTP